VVIFRAKNLEGFLKNRISPLVSLHYGTGGKMKDDDEGGGSVGKDGGAFCPPFGGEP